MAPGIKGIDNKDSEIKKKRKNFICFKMSSVDSKCKTAARQTDTVARIRINFLNDSKKKLVQLKLIKQKQRKRNKNFSLFISKIKLSIFEKRAIKAVKKQKIYTNWLTGFDISSSSRSEICGLKGRLVPKIAKKRKTEKEMYPSVLKNELFINMT